MRRAKRPLGRRVIGLLVAGFGLLMLLVVLTVGAAAVSAKEGLRTLQTRGMEPAGWD